MTRTRQQRRSRKTASQARRPPPTHFAPPPPLDREKEYAYIRRDLIGIIIWGGGLVLGMILMRVFNVFG